MDIQNPRPILTAIVQRLFPLGFVAVTPNAELSLSHADIGEALGRHASGDWGILDADDWQANQHALEHGGRLFSVYRAEETGARFYVITEADRSTTTVLLPEDY